MTDPILQIDLWDVGQGDCTVIKLPSGKLLIIDVGPRGSPVVDWLNERRHEAVRIEAIVLTHNDADHAGALPSIITEYRDRIGGIWMLLDREVSAPQFQKIFRSALEGENRGFYRIRRLENGQTLWEGETRQDRLHVIYPGFSENIQATDPNETSGVIVLESGKNRLVAWPGDLDLRTASAVLASRPPWLLIGPHHGGPSDYPTKALRQRKSTEALKNRGAEMRRAVAGMRPSRAYISVGTKNHYQHPRPGYLRLLASHGARVVCSQLTFCCERERVRYNAHLLQGSALLGLRPPRTGTSCRGSMRLVLKDGKLIPDEFDLIHLERVSTLLRPQCLRGTGWRRGDPLPKFAAN
jgi:beta-lactamase superfamily II metal-dependent hydrolase